MVVA
ncbi:hypothetical protein N499_1167A, partial [Wolbachia pipientis wVitA]|jgi:predicted Zn-dependent protease